MVCHYVECAPCGLRGDCPFEKKCLTSIQVDEVYLAVEQALAGVRTATFSSESAGAYRQAGSM